MNNQKTNIGSAKVKPTREIDLKLLALDLDTCTRCIGTLSNIEVAIDKVKNILDVTNTNINVSKILIESEEHAKAHRFVSSPTIRINDRDIVFETLESECDSCTDLCGCEGGVSCRIWKYQGQEYTEAPVGLIVESLMAEIYGSYQEKAEKAETYQVPQNLKQFFAGETENKDTGTSACCSAEKQETCCEPSEKEGCCGTEESETCGCQ